MGESGGIRHLSAPDCCQGLGIRRLDADLQLNLARAQPAQQSDFFSPGRSAHKSLGEIGGLCLPGGLTAGREPVDMSGIPFPYQDLDAFENKAISSLRRRSAAISK